MAFDVAATLVLQELDAKIEDAREAKRLDTMMALMLGGARKPEVTWESVEEWE